MERDGGDQQGEVGPDLEPNTPPEQAEVEREGGDKQREVLGPDVQPNDPPEQAIYQDVPAGEDIPANNALGRPVPIHDGVLPIKVRPMRARVAAVTNMTLLSTRILRRLHVWLLAMILINICIGVFAKWTELIMI